MKQQRKSVLFVCVGNAVRSQLAEAILRAEAGDRFEAFSAGTAPRGVDPRALHELDKMQISSEGLYSKSVDSFGGRPFDFVITLCDKSRQECDAMAQAAELIAWDIADPSQTGIALDFYRAAHELQERIKLFCIVHTKSESA
ncbi:MAG: arsenate reductase ArsC [Moraxellaceae bacterium]